MKPRTRVDVWARCLLTMTAIAGAPGIVSAGPVDVGLRVPPPSTVMDADRAEDARAARSTTAEAWKRDGTEANAASLFDTYFNEIPAARTDAVVDPAELSSLLDVVLPADGPYSVMMKTRGMRFDVLRPVDDVSETVTTTDVGVSFGPRHAWRAGGFAKKHPPVGDAARWTTDRIEEYFVADQARTSFSRRVEVLLPPEVTTVRDAGRALEFMTESGASVLRYHYAVASDVDGQRRMARTRLLGVADQPTMIGAFPAYQVVDALLVIEYEIDLEGLAEPVVVDPGWSSTHQMQEPRFWFFMGSLPSGLVLVADGRNQSSSSLTSCELYHPQGPSGPFWTYCADTQRHREQESSANLPVLPNGKVLLVGLCSGPPGCDLVNFTDAAEVYDPATDTWTLTPSPGRHFQEPAIVRIEAGPYAGDVLAIGGRDHLSNLTRTGARYDAGTNSWTSIPPMLTYTMGAAAVAVGPKVVVAGGSLPSFAEVLDCSVSPPTWVTGATPKTNPSIFAYIAALPNGNVLVGAQPSNGDPEVFTPSSSPSWSFTDDPSSSSRSKEVMVRLPSGRVLRLGGVSAGLATDKVDEYNWSTNLWTSRPAMPGGARVDHRAVVLATGNVLSCGGAYSWGGTAQARCDIYDTSSTPWVTGVSMVTPRIDHTATKLPDGRVLVVGGRSSLSGGFLSSTEIYVPAAGLWTPGPYLNYGSRSGHTAVLVQGKVIVAGGENSSGPLNTVESYDPATNLWTSKAAMYVARVHHVAALTSTAYKMMVASDSTAEVYNASSNAWTNATNNAPGSHGFGATASLLSSGVLVIGGYAAYGNFDLLYTPPWGSNWAAAGTVPSDGYETLGHSATNIGSGALMKVGGKYNAPGGTWETNAARIYTTASNSWSTAAFMNTMRYNHTATTLQTGHILIAGGTSYKGPPTQSEVYDYGQNTWITALRATMGIPRHSHTATLLDTGIVLMTGGQQLSNGSVTSSTELYQER